MSEQLSKQDVARLLTDPSPDHRAELAAKIAVQFDKAELSQSEREIAIDIIRLMARDAIVLVRQSLADNLKNSSSIPRDIAVTLAKDVEAVALPVLSVSRVLTEQDLLEVINSGSAAKQTAIAGRPEVPEKIADALIQRGGEDTVATLVANAGAAIGESGFNKVIDRFGTSPKVQGPLVQRAQLPLTVAERLVTLVSENLQQYLVTHHELSPTIASDLVLQSRERATASLLGGENDEAAVERLVSQLVQGGRLTPSLLVRSLCMGDIAFFEAGMANLARIPTANARLLIHDPGRRGLASLYERAGLPPQLLQAVRIALDVARETPFDGEDHDIERHRRRMIERILTQYEDLGSDDIDYLLNKLSDLMPAA